MIHMIRYTVKPEQVAENERLAAAVYESLRASRPAGLRYATFRHADGASFVHLVAYESADRSDTLTGLPAFKAFSAGVKERCVAAPVRVELREVGSYGFFEG